ncbi:MAG: 6-carboxytetrahydropterin synthase QueD [bacterium]|nr:6-carboxytetrahydropterin synthase QueD [bacterium]
MYQVRIETEFCAAHRIMKQGSKCSRLHGHNWKIEVVASHDKLDESGMVIDFHKLEDLTKKVVEPLDHQNLNELAPFSNSNPTAEKIAEYIYYQASLLGLEKLLPAIKLEKVTVWETPTTWASYSKGRLSN